MKLNASTAIALALVFSSVVGQTAAVSASSVSGDSPRQDQRVTPQDQIENATKTHACFMTLWGIKCC